MANSTMELCRCFSPSWWPWRTLSACKVFILHTNSWNFAFGRKFPLLGMTSEIYSHGIGVLLFCLFTLTSPAIFGKYFLPMFYKYKVRSFALKNYLFFCTKIFFCLQFKNCYAYFEHRFHSKLLRILTTLGFVVSTLLGHVNIYFAILLWIINLRHWWFLDRPLHLLQSLNSPRGC